MRLLPVLFFVAALVPGLPARALLVMTVDDIDLGSTPEVIVADQQGPGFITPGGLTTTHGDSFGSTVGVVSYIGPVGAFSSFNAVATSRPLAGGSPVVAVLSTGFSAESSGAGRLVVSSTDTDQILPTQPEVHPMTFELFAGAASPSVTGRSNIDPANAEFSTSTAAVGPLAAPLGGSVSGTTSAALGAAPFSLSQQIRIIHSGAQDSFASGLSTVELPCPCFDDEGPEPTYCFDRHSPSLNSWAYTFPGSFLQVTNLWCRDNALFQWIAPNEAIACDAALHRRCNPMVAD